MKKVAVILSGCGVFDGSEIYESVITLLTLDRKGAQYQCFAPNIEQMHVIDHLKGEVAAGETRNVLVEAARLARGDIKDLSEARAEDFDAIIFPGGFGAAKNLSNFATQGSAMQVNGDVLRVAKAFATANKPAGYICIAPALVSAIYDKGVTCTVGNDPETAKVLAEMGAAHKECAVEDIVVDEHSKLVTTPAYMLATRISEAATGIEKLVNKVLALC